ncbi:ATP-binding protein (plasmid) [Bacillus sp. JZ8]
MSTPGIGDPYWYEWYVGLEQVIKMINPDNYISYVTFQSEIHNTIDDVVVGYQNKHEVCFQVKHEVGDAGKGNLTFSKLIEPTIKENGREKVSLIKALAIGWEDAKRKEVKEIIPVLYTNRKLGVNNTTRTFRGEEYKALSLAKFIEGIQEVLKQTNSIQEIERLIGEKEFRTQWLELKDAINDDDTTVINFLKALQIKYSEGSLDDLEKNMIESIKRTFSCDQIVANNLFDKLCSNLRIWTTTRRETKVKVTVEDVFDALSINNDIEQGEHKLPYPSPFFQSRQDFSENLVEFVNHTDKKIVFISGDPGSGKTSLISYLQLNHNIFKARYHTFKPISPEQKFYNSDPGLCQPEALWNDLLIQIRSHFKGELNKYNIPVTNALCTVEQMRKEVLRLSEILYKKTGEKTVICVDGIDHAARTNNELTFLPTLFNPTEIPEGVIFTIVGQPAELYDKYPIWIRNKTEGVEYIQIPKLLKEDIISLFKNKQIKFSMNEEVLAEFIYEKTKGNNLSVVFAIEEARVCKNIEDFERILDERHVSGDITVYYSHIWKHVSKYLISKNLGFAFPDTVVASAITLLNGRVNSEVLSKALKINLFKDDWEELLGLLYPLVQRVDKENEYALFHNDFRVFLMATINQDGAKYRNIATQLADYYMIHNDSVESLVNLIPLLISAGKNELIAEVFNTQYVINSLAHGVSRIKLDEYAYLAYQAALESKNWKIYHNIYLALNTLSQHYKYYEYFDKEYTLKDKSYVKRIHSFELNSLELNINNLENYKEMLNFCIDLLSYKDSISIRRAYSIFNLWMKNLTPPLFIERLKKSESAKVGLWDGNQIGEIMKKWAQLAAYFNSEYMIIDSIKRSEEDVEDLESEEYEETIRASLQFNNAYFKYLLEHNEVNKSINIIKYGGVSYSSIEDSLVKILFNYNTTEYKEILEKLIENRPNLNDQLFARVCLIESRQDVKINNLNELEPITYITDQTSLKIVLFSIIKGFQEYNKDVYLMVDQIIKNISEIERKGSDYEYLKVLIRHGFILGRSIKKLDGGLDKSDKNLLLNSYKEFLLYDTNSVRVIDFIESFNILLFLSLHPKWALHFVEKPLLNEFVIEHLFKRKLLGMHYKSIILDFLLANGAHNIVKEYLVELYGQNGVNLFQGNNFEETHNHFKKYGQIVFPELMEEVNKKLKWDVVGYVNHKEYALWPILQYFKKIKLLDKREWKYRGIKLYKLSCIADIKGNNRASFEIQREVSSAAIECGLEDIWMLRQQDREFRFSLEILYNQIFDLINNARDIDDIMAIWFLSCGILSWYNDKDRQGIKNIYNACVKKGVELDYLEIKSLLCELTPQHIKIATFENGSRNIQYQNEYTLKRESEEAQLRERLSNFSNDEIIEYLRYEPDKLLSWTSPNVAWDIIESRAGITEQVAIKFVEIVVNRLEDYSWENSGCNTIIEKIFRVLKSDFLWELAKHNQLNLDDKYYTCSSNMNFLLQFVTSDSEESLLQDLFDNEMNCHHLWITGCGNLANDFAYTTPSISKLPSPENIHQFVLNILIEQIETNNIHKIEICLQGIQLLIGKYPALFSYLSNCWDYYNEEQKDYLIKLSERWSQKSLQGFHYLKDVLEREYISTNELNRKIQLYFILKNYNLTLESDEDFIIQYNAKAIDYNLPNNYPLVCNYLKVSQVTNRFLSAMTLVTSEPNEDIKYYIEAEKDISTLGNKRDNLSRPGDCILYPSDYQAFDSKVLYGEEQKGRWRHVPIPIKAQFILSNDDAWIISEIPNISFSEEWYIEKELKKFLEQGQLSKCKPYFKKIVNKNVPENMLVIGSCIWYPIESKEGIIYTETAKVISDQQLIKNSLITSVINPGSILSATNELLAIEQEDYRETGICLANAIVGTGVLFYGNSMVYPSMFLREILDIRPSKDSPLIWVNKDNEVVMYFERFAAPLREATHQLYFRQPIMSRWVCNEELLNREIRKYRLTYYQADKIELMPSLGGD